MTATDAVKADKPFVPDVDSIKEIRSAVLTLIEEYQVRGEDGFTIEIGVACALHDSIALSVSPGTPQFTRAAEQLCDCVRGTSQYVE